MALRSSPAGNGFLRLALASRLDGRARRHERDQVADMNHADRIVERVVIGDQPRMAGILEHFHKFAERDVLLHGDDVGARHHDVVDAPFAQPKNILEHGAFFRREAGFARRAFFEHFLQIGADRTGPPAERARAATCENTPSLASLRSLPASPARGGCD